MYIVIGSDKMGSIDIFNIARNAKSTISRKFNSNKLLSIEKVCEILDVQIPSGLDSSKKFSMICCFEGVFIKNCLFVNYEYYEDSRAKKAMRDGATAILSAKQFDDYPCIIVSDVKTAVRKICSYLYKDIMVPSTVITGSIGKTTCKNLINCVYATHRRTFCNITNGNTFEYLGFELQRFDKKADLFVQEVNESDPFNTYHSSLLLKPKIAAITNMDRSHIGELGSEENIMKAICEITEGMDVNGIVLLNADDKNSMKVKLRQRVITVAIHNQKADCVAKNIIEKGNKVEFDLYYEGETTHIILPISGIHNIYNAQMAFIAGRLNNIPIHKIVKGIQNYRPLGFRQNTYTAGSKTLYVDCYNASARSVNSALHVIDKMDCKGKRIAVLGDIAEIEGFEEETYADIASAVSQSDTAVLITYGKDSKLIHKNLRKDEIRSFHANTKNELHELIKRNTEKNDILLFKASRSMGLEQAIKKVFPFAYVKGMLPVWLSYLNWTMKTL